MPRRPSRESARWRPASCGGGGGGGRGVGVLPRWCRFVVVVVEVSRRRGEWVLSFGGRVVMAVAGGRGCEWDSWLWKWVPERAL